MHARLLLVSFLLGFDAFFFRTLTLSLFFVNLALRQTLFNCLTDDRHDKSDRLRSIVVCWNWEVNRLWVRVRIANREYWQVQLVCFLHGNVLTLHVHDEQSSWQARKISNTAKNTLQFLTLTRKHQTLTLCNCCISGVVFYHLV